MFLEAVTGTTPLAGRDRLAVPPPPAAPLPRSELPAEVQLTVEGDGRAYAARAPGVSRAQIAELRAGKLRAEDTLDLHGDTIAHATTRLRRFLVDAGRIGRRCVLVVHGKGLHSDAGAPLREAMLHELLGPLSGLVRALATAAPTDGGEGATYILLRGRK